MLSLFGFHKVAEMRGDGLLPEFLGLTTVRPLRELPRHLQNERVEHQPSSAVDEWEQQFPIMLGCWSASVATHSLSRAMPAAWNFALHLTFIET